MQPGRRHSGRAFRRFALVRLIQDRLDRRIVFGSISESKRRIGEKLESQGLTRHSGDEVIDLENSKTEPGSPASYVVRLSAERQKRIQAGIMSTHARFLDTPGFKWESHFREAFDVYARELLKSSFDPQVLLDEVIPELVSDEGIRHRWHRSFHGRVERDASHPIKYGNYWVNPQQIQLLKRAVEGRQLAWKARQLRHLRVISVPGDSPTTAEDVGASRSELLAEYKRRTGGTYERSHLQRKKLLCSQAGVLSLAEWQAA